MAEKVAELLTETFPHIDSELVDYVTGVLDSSSGDVNSTSDVYEAIGDILGEVAVGWSEEDVVDFCDSLFHLVKLSHHGSSHRDHLYRKVLDSPVSLNTIINSQSVDNDPAAAGGSIWMTRRDDGQLKVDQKKLERAEAKIKQKQEKRAQETVGSSTNGSAAAKAADGLGDATTSQQINRRDAKMDEQGTMQSYDIKIENFDVSFGDTKLITGATITLSFGRRYGLVGRNGRGKSTLLRMIASGSLKIPTHISMLFVEQEVVGDDTIALQSVLESDQKRESLLQQERTLNELLAKDHLPEGERVEASERLATVYHKLAASDADRAPSRAAAILSGLGFDSAMQEWPTRRFSGGWRMRLALARALFSLPDLLLLDEPTNMLDMKAIIWLEAYLRTWPSTLLLVSHDRSFLNSVITDVLHLHSCTIDAYRGDYDQFEATREETLRNRQKEYEAQKEYRDHIQIFIDRFRYNANRASQVQSKLKLLDKLPKVEPVVREADVVFKFPETAPLAGNVLQLDEVQFYYTPDKVLFNGVNLSATNSSRICIVGENGAGKTTLLKILLGDLAPTKGLRHSHRSLRIGYFTQHHIDQLDLNASSVELLASRYPGLSMEQYRSVLGSFELSGDVALRTVISLSGGQKSRVAFSLMAMQSPNFLILDEPTNHLDVETVEALGKALEKFEGGVILVSHDERMIRNLCKELWVCSGGRVAALEGGIDEYRRLVEKEIASSAR